MKIKVSKLDAAESQLKEAITLFFEERDPVSIHTLACASLGILHDHFTNKLDVYDNKLFLHPDSIYIKDEYRSYWIGKVREFQNFFKHADRDLKDGKTEIEFNIETTDAHIFEAIRCLAILKKDSFTSNPEFQIFWGWYWLKYPDHLSDEGRKILGNLPKHNISPNDRTTFLAALRNLKNPTTLRVPSRDYRPSPIREAKFII